VLTTFRLLFHLRKLIFSKNARPSTDFNALIEKRHRDANLKIFKNANPGDAQTRTNTTKPKRKRAESSGRARSSRQVSLTDESSDLSETPDDSTMDSEDSIVRPAARGRVKAKSTSAPFRVALRLCRAISSAERSTIELLKPYDSVFIDDSIDSVARCFDLVDRQIETRCTHIKFHPPEDISLQNRICIERDSEKADKIFEQVVTMMRNARNFPGEPSYRTVEVEFWAGKVMDD
jgi:hypothetical protein